MDRFRSDALRRAPEPAPPAEETLARLAASVGPLRRVLAAIAARLLETRAWERLCYARLGDYARERAGVSARQLQDLARTHRALARLPALERALLANELPWSKVRLLARVASPADEAAWIARARAAPIRRLEQEVRASARRAPGADEDPDETTPLARVVVHCTPAVREKWLHAREMAERVAGQRLRAGEALEWVTAELCSELPFSGPVARLADEEASLWDDEDEGGDEAERAGDGAPGAPTRDGHEPAGSAASDSSPSLPAEAAALAEGLAWADPFELDRRLRCALALEQRLDAAMAPLLRVVRAADYEWREAWRPLGVYAAESLGISGSKARALLRIERAGDVCPALREAFRTGRISWAKAQCLVPLLLLDVEGGWRSRWVAWAERVTLRRLEADVERALLLRAAHPPAWERCKADPARAQDPIPEAERQLCAPGIELDATERLVWRVPREVAVLFVAVRETLRARMRAARGHPPSDSEVFGAILDRALEAWDARPPGARPDPVIVRDGYRCAVPGCSSRRNLHDHHVRFRSAGGSDAPDNRITLCAFHHLRCLHAHRMRVRGRAPGGLVFELGVRPGAPPLARYRSGDLLLPVPGASAMTA
ncbi:MAG TPA: hypothetical protein VIN04_09960 [Myxococcota bacterium]